MGCIVSSHESKSTKLIQAVGQRTSAWWMDMRIVYPGWDMGVRRLIVVAGNCGNWDWIDPWHWMGLIHDHILTTRRIDNDSQDWPLYWLSETLVNGSISLLLILCLSILFWLYLEFATIFAFPSVNESSLMFTEIESVLEAIVSNFCSSFIESDYKSTLLWNV